MDLNRENIIVGQIGKIECGENICAIEVIAKSGNIAVLTSSHYVKMLTLETGKNINILLNPLDVYITKPIPLYLGVVNSILGRIRRVHLGDRVAAIVLDSDAGEILALMSADEWRQTELKEGDHASAVFKAGACRLSTEAYDPHQQALEF
ncbi:MAG: hypothetical protein Kow0090_11490 [Myxococcota bacterium]